MDTAQDYRNWQEGKNFSYFYSGNNISTGVTINLALSTGKRNIFITKVEISGSSELITWSWYNDSDIVKGSGTPIGLIPLNSLVSSNPGTLLELNPTINFDGSQIIPGSIDAMGMPASEGKSRVNEVILNANLSIPRNKTQIIRIVQRSPTATTRNIELSVNFTIM